MAEWKLVPCVRTPEMVAAAHAQIMGSDRWAAELAATPPMPREEWDAMVERAARAICAAECSPKDVWRAFVTTAHDALRAALPGLVVEGDQEDRDAVSKS